MSHIIVERRTLYWPRTLGGSGVSTLAIPGLPHLGTFTNAPDDAAASFTGDTYASLRGSLEAASMRVDFPSDTVAIGIAPDSIIHSCDISIGGRADERSRFVITPGSPVIGCQGDTHALVSIRQPIPVIAASGDIAFDSNAVNTVVGPGGTVGAAWPLRLEIFRACVVPPQRSDKRAPMSSLSLFNIPAEANRELYVCVDGRTRVDIEVIVPGGSPGITFEVFSCAPLRDEPSYDTFYAIPVALDEAGTLSEAIGASGSEAKVYSFYGNPFGVLQVNMTAGAGATVPVQVRIRAWD